jgi:hypothetical protein
VERVALEEREVRPGARGRRAAETDLAKRKQMYADLQTMIHEQAGIGIRCSWPASTATATKLKGLSPIPLAA